MEEKKLYFDDINIQLKKIDFKKGNDIPQDFKDEISVKINDFYDVKILNNNSFAVCFERKVGLNPDYMFDISVEFECIFVLNEKTVLEYKNNDDELKELINIKIEKLLKIGNVIGRASSLISTITMQVGLNPIVTPPSLQK